MAEQGQANNPILVGGVAITVQDVIALLNTNPLAAAQIKGIALEREKAALEARVAELSNGKTPVKAKA